VGVESASREPLPRGVASRGSHPVKKRKTRRIHCRVNPRKRKQGRRSDTVRGVELAFGLVSTSQVPLPRRVARRGSHPVKNKTKETQGGRWDWPLQDIVLLEAFVDESIILLLTLPPALPTRLQYYCDTIAQYSNLLQPPVFILYTIQYCTWQYRV